MKHKILYRFSDFKKEHLIKYWFGYIFLGYPAVGIHGEEYY